MPLTPAELEAIQPFIDSDTGKVTLATNPDHESQDTYGFTIVATDTAGNQSQSQSVNLVINDEQLAITSSSTADAVDEKG